MTASALLASHWPELYSRGLIAVEETPEPDADLIRRRECSRVRQARLRAARKAAGCCDKCDAPRIPGRSLCTRHAEWALKYSRARKESAN